MRKASDFLSKPVISLREGKNEGIIKDISFGPKLKTADWLALYDENDADCEEKAVRLSDVYALGENAVMIKSGQAVVPAVSAPLCSNNPINCRVFNADGRLLGTVSDVVMTDRNAVSELVYDNDKALPLSEVLSGSRGVIVSGAGQISVKALNVPKARVPAPRPGDIKRKVKALSNKEDKKENEAAPPAAVAVTPEELAPADVTEKPVIAVTTAAPAAVENAANENPVTQTPDPVKIYGDLSARFGLGAANEIYVYENNAETEERQNETGQQPEQVKIEGQLNQDKDGKLTGQDNPRESEEELGKAVPIKKNNSRREQWITAYQFQPDNEPLPPLIFDNGERIEVWPFELDHIPERIIASYTFLLGRKVAKNIYNASREIVIKADTVVSPQTVETARKYGRLVDLTKLSI